MLPEDYLQSLKGAADLHAMSTSELYELAEQLRPFLTETVLQNGGHLASNLGLVELTLALHKVLDLPDDRLILDVGHQSYVHKILSGRKDDFSTLRTGGGLSGFTKRAESEYDAFGCGHSSTSVSAAIGFAHADLLAGRKNCTVAVFGDGAFTGGMIHEALNNCPRNANLILILNENEMSISHNIGRYSKHLSKIRTSKYYYNTKRFTKSVLLRIPLIGKPCYRLVSKCKAWLKQLRYHANYFEALGLHYVGPVDGHNIGRLVTVLAEAKRRGQTTVVHVKTKKGKGYLPAEQNPALYHGVAPRDVQSPKTTFSAQAGTLLCELAEQDSAVCAITAAMCEGTGLTPFRTAYPKRFFDVGIAEEHALTFAAGLAAGGMRPFVAIYSTFLQRGYDNLIHDIALQRLPVTVLIDRAGLNLRDGATHHGIFDCSFLNMIPHFCLTEPLSYAQLKTELMRASDGPHAIRYPSGGQNEAVLAHFAKAEQSTDAYLADAIAQNAPPVLIVTYGRITSQALEAAGTLCAEGTPCGVVALQRLKPIAPYMDSLRPLLADCKKILFLEEGIACGGIGQSFEKALRAHGITVPCQILAIEDTFVESMPNGIYNAAGISARHAVAALRDQEAQA